jgi:amidase
MFDPLFEQHFLAIIAADSEATFQAFEMLLGRPIRDDELEPRNVAHRENGRALGSVGYLHSRSWISTWARQMAAWWLEYDLLLTPTLAAPPPQLGWFTDSGLDVENERISSFIPYTPQFNLTGQPAVSLPLHWTPDGLPVGIQLVGGFGREDLLVRIASQLEQAAPWHDRRPPVHG